MGQRHQVYVIYRDNEKDAVMAFHSQWSYGTLPIRALDRVINFLTNTDKMYWYEADRVLEGVLSVDIPTGTFSGHTEITKEVIEKNGKVNPDLGHNNDGITIIDARDIKSVKYGFTFLYNRDDENVLPYVIMNAEQYLKSYYTEFLNTPAEKIGSILENVMSHKLIAKKDLSVFATKFKNKFNTKSA